MKPKKRIITNLSLEKRMVDRGRKIAKNTYKEVILCKCCGKTLAQNEGERIYCWDCLDDKDGDYLL